MAASQAVIEWTSKDAAVLRSFQQMERNMQSLARKLDQIKTASTQASNEGVAGFNRWMGAAKGLAASLIGAGSIVAAFDMIREANRKAMREAEESGKKFDDLFRKFRIQAGLNEVQGEWASGRIKRVAGQAGVWPEIAQAGAMGLVGAGFTVEQATGGSLREVLRAGAATNAPMTPAMLEEISGNAAGYLTSQGMDLNEANLRRVMASGFALRQTGKFELSDLTQLGVHGSAFKGLVSMEEQFAAFGTLRDMNFPAAEAGTALRNIVSRLSTSRVGRTSPKALKEIGLTPEDVDLVDEDLMTAMQRIEAGLATIPEADRAGVKKMLFEEAGVAPATALMEQRTGRYAEYRRALSTAETGYAEAAKVGQAGRAAAEARQGGLIETMRAAEDAGDDLVLQALELDARLHNQGPITRAIDAWTYSGLRAIPGVSQEAALGAIGTGGTGFGGDTEFAKRILGEAARAARGDLPPRMERVADIEARQAREAEERARAEADRRRRGLVIEESEDGMGWTLGPSRIKTSGLGRLKSRGKPVEVKVINQQQPEPRSRVTPSAALGR